MSSVVTLPVRRREERESTADARTRVKYSMASCGIECASNWESKNPRMVGYKISNWSRATALVTADDMSQ